MDQPTRVLYCNCTHAEVIPRQVKREVLRRLSAAGVAFEAVPDLCELSARRDPALKRIAESGDLRIAACFPRAVEWLFHAAGAPLAKQRVEVLNMRRQSAEQVVAGLLPDAPVAHVGRSTKELDGPDPGAWIPWFPVIDYERCTNCKQCLSFCLFGVFGLDADDRVEVRKPDHCKTGCPACSRVCPCVAIIFPKYDKRPINGDEVREEDLERGAVQVDVSELLGGDALASLRARSRGARQRFAPGRNSSDPDSKHAEYLRAAKSELDIPDAVLAELGCDCGGRETPSGGGDECAVLPSCCEPPEQREPAAMDVVDCPCLNYLTKAAAELGMPDDALSHLTCQCALQEAQPTGARDPSVPQSCCGSPEDRQPGSAGSDCCSCVEYFTKAGTELGIPGEVLAKMAQECNNGGPPTGSAQMPAATRCGCESDDKRPPAASAEERGI